MIDVFTYGPGTDEGCFDTSVADDLGCEGAEEGLALVGGAAEFGDFFSVAHHGEFGAGG